MVLDGLYRSTGTPTPISVTSIGAIHVASASSAGLGYVATPTSGKLTTMPVYTLTTAGMTSGARIAGSSSAASTNITAGLYRLVANGNTFYMQIGGTAATTTTKAYVINEGTTEPIYLATTKLSTICMSAAGALYLTKLA